MKRVYSVAGLLGALLFAATVLAQAPAGTPAGTTGVCKDGTNWTGATKKGACRGHKGVKTWYGGAEGAAAATPTAAQAEGVAPAAPAAPATAAAPAAAKKSKTTPAPAAEAAPGGGPGMVWVNTPTKVYHCTGDRWYGKTKQGSYMTESAAVAAGARPDHGKACK
jgi:hypothetical protein